MGGGGNESGQYLLYRCMKLSKNTLIKRCVNAGLGDIHSYPCLHSGGLGNSIMS